MSGVILNYFKTRREEIRKEMNFFLHPSWGKLDFVVISMGFISTVTFLSGFVYVLPTETFALSKSFLWMRDHGGENFWGIICLLAGSLGLVATYLEYYRVKLRLVYGVVLPLDYRADRIFGRWVWFATALLWGFVGCSFLVNVPVSPGAAVYIPLGIFSFIVSSQARNRRDNGD